MENSNQRVCIKFCLKLLKSCVEAIEKMQKAFGHQYMAKTQMKEWYKRFNFRTSVDRALHSGRQSIATTPHTVRHVQLMVGEDPRLSVLEVESDVVMRKTIGIGE